MAANFIPPIDLGQFKPSAAAISSWLYEVWKYLQENPIPSADDITGDAEQVAENYVAENVPPMIASAIAALSYAQFVADTTLPIYRAANDEISNQDLIEAWDDGCRFALVDDENVYVMIRNGNTVNLLQILTEQQAEGVVSVNGQSGVVVLKTSDLQNDSGYINSAGAPVQSVNGQTGAVVIPNATTSAAGLMSAADKIALGDKVTTGTSADLVAIELTPTQSAGNGGFIDFHFNGATGDNTSRIIEIGNGIISINGVKFYNGSDFSMSPAQITITPNTSVISSVGGKQAAYQFGRVVCVTFDFMVQSAANQSMLFEMAAPIAQGSFAIIGDDNKAYKTLLNTNGQFIVDGAALPAGWYNGSISYITAN